MTDLFENYSPPWMDEELSILRDAARKFFTAELAPQQETWEANGIVDCAAWTKTGAAGFLLSEVPARYGGGGGDYRHETVIMEEQLRAGASGLGTQVHRYTGTQPDRCPLYPALRQRSTATGLVTRNGKWH